MKVTTTAALTSEPNWTELNANDFLTYDFVRDYSLKYWELRESGKYLEFCVRFVKTSIPIAKESFVDSFSQTLRDQMRMTFQELKNSPGNYGLTETHLANIDYWLEHDMKDRSVWYGADVEAQIERSTEQMTMPGYALTEKRTRPELSVSPWTQFKIPLGAWRWYNKVDTIVRPQHEIYEYDENGTLTRENQTSLFYEAWANSKIERDEINRFSLGTFYKGYVNPTADSLKNAFDVNGVLELGTFVRGRPLTGSIRGEYNDENYAAPAVAGLPTNDYKALTGSGNAKYQWGAAGVNVDAAYSDVHQVTAYESKDSNIVNGTAVYLTTRGIATIEAGLNGEREEYATSLTGLSGVEGNARGTAKVQLKLPKNFTLIASAAGGAVRSDGSLVGWFGELKDSKLKLEYGLGRKTAAGERQPLGTVSVSLGANYYDRTLDYVSDESAAVKVDQTQIMLSVGPGFMLVPTDYFKVEAGGYVVNTDQRGFLPVDSFTAGADAKVSLRLTKKSAKLNTWLYALGGYGKYTLASENLGYETDWAYASLNVTTRNF